MTDPDISDVSCLFMESIQSQAALAMAGCKPWEIISLMFQALCDQHLLKSFAPALSPGCVSNASLTQHPLS